MSVQVQAPAITTSSIVKQAHFEAPWFAETAALMNESPSTYHRKTFEFVVASRVYQERIGHGGLSLGFAIAHDPMPAFIVAHGGDVVCTNIDQGDTAAKIWQDTGQHVTRVQDLRFWGICPQEALLEHASWAYADMRDLPPALCQAQFDYVFSSGGRRAGLDFVLASVACMAPDGWATHTTEYNMNHTATDAQTSNDPTLCLFTQRDLRTLVGELDALGVDLLPLDFTSGTQPYDLYIDRVPYRARGHLKLQIGPWVSTSICLVLHKRV